MRSTFTGSAFTGPAFFAFLSLTLFLACQAEPPADDAGGPDAPATDIPVSGADRPTSPVDVSLDPYIGRLVTIDVAVGSDSARLILDTGGGVTVISPAVAARLGCTPSGRSIGYRMNGERIEFAFCADVTVELAGVPFGHDRIGVWDVQSLLPAGVPPVDGVLSLKTLANRPFTLRLADRMLTLETPESLRRRVAAMTRVESRLATGTDGDELTVFVRGVAAEADTAWFLVDSANLDAVLLGPHIVRDERESREGELALDHLPAIETSFRTEDIIYDGVLSEAFIGAWNWTFDLSTNSVWAAPAR